MADPTQQRRRSIFRETGLLDDVATEVAAATVQNSSKRDRPATVRFRSKDEVRVIERYPESAHTGQRVHSTSPLSSTALMYRLGGLAFILALAFPMLQSTGFLGQSALPVQPVDAGVIPVTARSHAGVDLSRRDDSPTDVCFRWAQQSAVVNGTLYLYGGQASTSEGQTENTWNNDFLTLDLTKSWDIGTPSLTGLPQPSGPPAVALGTLWSSHESLFLYGGQVSWKPIVKPGPYATWEYSIPDQQWIEHSNPKTSSGKSAPSNNDPVQGASEGASISVPSLGRGFYFGGHLDEYTTQSWANYIPRQYLQSLLEFTFPDRANPQVDALSNGQNAGSDGNYRNVTEGGLQSKAGFTDRADGILVYVPGFGDEGILIAMAGGTNETYTQMNNVDVYDIAKSEWYKQSTAGPTPTMRVNPCAGVAAAPDGSSYNIYMFGGQNLIPYGNQSQFDDMWILTVPSFTWIQVDMSKQSVPYGRSGHTCNVWNGQMVMVGGYVGTQLTCESPGIYVFDMSNLAWVQKYTAISAGSASGSDTSSSASSAASGTAAADSSSPSASSFVSTGANNPFNQQAAQLFNGTSQGGLEGSYGYSVPAAVISVIGGGPTGGATITTPAASATAGPMATGKPITYTVTDSSGATVTETAAPGSPNSGQAASNNKKSGPNIAAIVAGVIAGLLFIAVCYLLFCTYVYRKQLALYKHHVEMAQRQARGEKTPAIPGLLASDQASKSSSDRRRMDMGGYYKNSEEASRVESGSKYSSQPQTLVGQGNSGGGSGAGYQSLRRESSEDEDLLGGREPTFVGVLLNPRRSLRVVNKD
ncbi:hypothetical protein B0A48_14573 [Cryoendolithus antarcticus]|uniref:Kelch repeat-containing protein n=1 Tax=Cryoendolithus antarcticus TaxID=1507870 RepID=A0A1V8SL53_9PEZI|nr:hypothetical protein B0A48_14573 [Cryoendolithus antarcticus]